MRPILLAGACVAALLAAALLRPPHVAPSSSALTRDVAPQFPRKPRSAAAAMVVYVVGAVAHSGLYHLSAGRRVNDAVAAAGGMTARADPAGVNLAETLQDGEQITVPAVGETVRSTSGRRAHKRRSHRRKGHRTSAASGEVGAVVPDGSIDINHADALTLEALPGVGPLLAQRLVDFRTLNGPFESVDALADVAGMTDSKIQTISRYITIR